MRKTAFFAIFAAFFIMLHYQKQGTRSGNFFHYPGNPGKTTYRCAHLQRCGRPASNVEAPSHAPGNCRRVAPLKPDC